MSLRNFSRIAVLPIGLDLLGNHAVLRIDELTGPVFWRDHELWDGPNHPHLIEIADDLKSFYNALGSKNEEAGQY